MNTMPKPGEMRESSFSNTLVSIGCGMAILSRGSAETIERYARAILNP